MAYSFLAAAVQSGMCDVLKHVLKRLEIPACPDVSKRFRLDEYAARPANGDETHPMQIAVRLGRLDLVQILVEHGMSVGKAEYTDYPDTEAGKEVMEFIIKSGAAPTRYPARTPMTWFYY